MWLSLIHFHIGSELHVALHLGWKLQKIVSVFPFIVSGYMGDDNLDHHTSSNGNVDDMVSVIKLVDLSLNLLMNAWYANEDLLQSQNNHPSDQSLFFDPPDVITIWATMLCGVFVGMLQSQVCKGQGGVTVFFVAERIKEWNTHIHTPREANYFCSFGVCVALNVE